MAPMRAWAGSYSVIARVLAPSGTVTDGGALNCHDNGGTCFANYTAPVTLTAVPDKGFSVQSWSGCTPSADKSTCSVAGTSSTVVFVYFQAGAPPPPPPNTINVRVLAPSGAVTGGPVDCYDNNGTCAANLTGPVTLTAIPDSGFTVQSWSGCTPGPDQTTCSVPGNASAVVSISFQSAPPPPPASYTLIARVLAASGTVAGGGIGCTDNTGTCSSSEPVGGTVTLAAVPTQGYGVKSWLGCTPNADLSSCALVMNSDAAVDVTFGQVRSCTVPNGTGTQPWDAAANGWGACTASACDAGYSLFNGTCVANVVSCTVPNGTGTQSWNPSTNSYDPCVASGAATYQIGGTVTGLASSGLVLATAGEPNLTVASGATDFTFANLVGGGTAYSIAVAQQPSGLWCSVTNGSGVIANASVASIAVQCDPPVVSQITGVNPPGNITNNTSVAFSFAANLPASEVAFTCSLDAGTFVACTSPVTYGPLADGLHQFVVHAVDLVTGYAETVGASYAWTIDTVPPQVLTVTTTLTSTSITVTWTTDRPATSKVNWGSGLDTSRVVPDDGVYVTSHSVKIIGLLPNTVYSFFVSGHDAAGNPYTSTKRQARTYQ